MSGTFHVLRALLLVFPLASNPIQESQDAGAQPSSAQVSDPAVLRVGGEEIGAARFGRWLIDNLGSRLARDYAHDWIVEREARRLGIAVSEEELRAVLDEEIQIRITHAFLGRKQDWLAELDRTGRSEGGLRRQRTLQLAPELAAKAIVEQDRVVPADKIEREWELRYGRNGRRYDLSMMKFGVIFRTPPSGTGAEEARRLRDEAIALRLVQARAARERIVLGADFGELAAELSEDPVTKANAGRLPAGFSHVGWPHEFLDTLDGLALGELSEPLYGRGGWWLVRIDGVDLTPLAEVRNAIEADLIARGPDQDEIGSKRAALAEGLALEILPSMWERGVPSDEVPEQVLAMRINGEPVARKTYALWLLHVRGEAAARHFVEHWVVERQAEQLGIEVGEPEIRARAVEFVEQLVLRNHGGDREAWKLYLARSTRDEEAFLRDLMVRMRVELLTEKLLMRERQITPEDVRAHWREVYGENGRALDVRMILLRVSLPKPAGAPSREELQALVAAESARVRERAAGLAARAREGQDFAALARKHSQETESAAQGGALPDRFRPEQWPEEIARAVQSLEPGAVSEPFDLGTAWVVFQVERVRSVEFEDVRADLLEDLTQARPSYGDLAAHRNQLMQRLEIEVLPAMYQ